MKAIKNIILAPWVIFMIALYAYLFWDKLLIEDPEQERIAPQLEEMQNHRIKLHKNY